MTATAPGKPEILGKSVDRTGLAGVHAYRYSLDRFDVQCLCRLSDSTAQCCDGIIVAEWPGGGGPGGSENTFIFQTWQQSACPAPSGGSSHWARIFIMHIVNGTYAVYLNKYMYNWTGNPTVGNVDLSSVTWNGHSNYLPMNLGPHFPDIEKMQGRIKQIFLKTE